MTTRQRTYWSSRSPALRTSSTTVRVEPNWSRFDRRATARSDRQQTRAERQQTRQERRDDRRNRRDD
jgi:hypothetical protein